MIIISPNYPYVVRRQRRRCFLLLFSFVLDRINTNNVRLLTIGKPWPDCLGSCSRCSAGAALQKKVQLFLISFILRPAIPLVSLPLHSFLTLLWILILPLTPSPLLIPICSLERPMPLIGHEMTRPIGSRSERSILLHRPPLPSTGHVGRRTGSHPLIRHSLRLPQLSRRILNILNRQSHPPRLNLRRVSTSPLRKAPNLLIHLLLLATPLQRSQRAVRPPPSNCHPQRPRLKL